MTHPKLRVGLIGLGGVGTLHLQAYRARPEIEVVAVADPFAPDLTAIAATAAVTGYRDAEAMLRAERPDIACVLTPAATHCDLTTLCARYGSHVLCEKPMALSVAQCEQMIAACAEAGVRLTYGASYRFLPALLAAHALIADGAIGKVLVMHETIVGGSGPAGRHAMGPAHYPNGGPGGSGFGLVDHGIHLIDAFMWLTGSAIVRAVGRGNRTGEAAGPEYLVAHLANGAVCNLLYEDGTFATHRPSDGVFSAGAGWSLGGPTAPGEWAEAPQSIHVHGTSGALRILPYANRLYHRNATGMRAVPLDAPPPPAHFGTQIAAMARDIFGGGGETPDGRDGLRALKVLLAAYDDPIAPDA